MLSRSFIIFLLAVLSQISKGQDSLALRTILETDNLYAFQQLSIPTAEARLLLPKVIESGAEEIALNLISSGQNYNQLTAEGLPLLHLCIQKENPRILKALLIAGADANQLMLEGLGASPLMWACSSPDVAFTQLLIQHGADINAIDKQGDPVINWAAYYGHQTVLEELIKAEVDLTVRSKHGDAADVLLRLWHHDSLLQVFHGTTIDSSEFAPSEAIQIVLEGDAERLRKTLRAGTSPNLRDGFGSPLLHLAASRGHLPIIALLIDAGVDINALNRVGQSALCIAARHGYHAIVQHLLKKEADPNATDSTYALTPLIGSSVGGHAEITQHLLDAGSHIDHREVINRATALHWALFYEEQDLANLLLAAGADYKTPLFDGSMTTRQLAKGYQLNEVITQIDQFEKNAIALSGSWQMANIQYIYPDTVYEVTKPALGIFVLSSARYVIQYHPSSQSRTPFADFSDPTCEDLKQAFQNLVFNTGQYQLTGDLLVTRPDLARVPGFEGARQQYRYELQGEYLTLTLEDEVYPNGQRPQWVGKIKVQLRFQRE